MRGAKNREKDKTCKYKQEENAKSNLGLYTQRKLQKYVKRTF